MHRLAVAGVALGAVSLGLLVSAWSLPLVLRGFDGPLGPEFVCFEPYPLLIDVQGTSGPGGQARSFAVQEGCRLEFDLDVRQMAGDLRVTVDGPGGRVYEHHAQGVQASRAPDTAAVLTDWAEEGEVPAGSYTYRYVVNGGASFTFTVRASRA